MIAVLSTKNRGISQIASTTTTTTAVTNKQQQQRQMKATDKQCIQKRYKLIICVVFLWIAWNN